MYTVYETAVLCLVTLLPAIIWHDMHLPTQDLLWSRNIPFKQPTVAYVTKTGRGLTARRWNRLIASQLDRWRNFPMLDITQKNSDVYKTRVKEQKKGAWHNTIASILTRDLRTPVARQHRSRPFVPVAVSVVFSLETNCSIQEHLFWAISALLFGSLVTERLQMIQVWNVHQVVSRFFENFMPKKNREEFLSWWRHTRTMRTSHVNHIIHYSTKTSKYSRRELSTENQTTVSYNTNSALIMCIWGARVSLYGAFRASFLTSRQKRPLKQNLKERVAPELGRVRYLCWEPKPSGRWININLRRSGDG